MTKPFTISIDETTLTALDDLADRTDSSRETLVREALANYLDLQAWQLGRVEEGLAAAERGDFATDEEVRAVFSKYGASY